MAEKIEDLGTRAREWELANTGEFCEDESRTLPSSIVLRRKTPPVVFRGHMYTAVAMEDLIDVPVILLSQLWSMAPNW